MYLVIDIQCLEDTDNNKPPKEIALVSLNGDSDGHWLVAPTACVNDLSEEISRRQNNCLTQHCHGINYLEGEVDLKVRHKTARFIEKWPMLYKIIANEIINL